MKNLKFALPLEKSFNPWFNSWNMNFFPEESIGADTRQPAVNILKKDNGFLLELLVPGFEKTDFTIEVQENILTIKGAVSENESASNPKKVGQTFNVQPFVKRFKLNETLDSSGIEANYLNGILQVVLKLKKIETPPVKTISIH